MITLNFSLLLACQIHAACSQQCEPIRFSSSNRLLPRFGSVVDIGTDSVQPLKIPAWIHEYMKGAAKLHGRCGLWFEGTSMNEMRESGAPQEVSYEG